jgi:hypothetical protein
LVWSLETVTPFINIDETSGSLKAFPQNDDVGEHTVIVNVTDGSHLWDRMSFMIEVINVNDPPNIKTDELQEAVEHETYRYGLSAIDIDPMEDTLSWTIEMGPDFLRIDQRKGILSGIPSNEDVGSHEVTVRVDDQKGGSDLETFTLIVHGVNDPPVIIDPAVSVNMEEDTFAELNMDSIFFDIDSTSLSYSVVHTNNFSHGFRGTILVLTPREDWYGEESVAITANDGEHISETEVSVEVFPVNDAPSRVEIEGLRIFIEGMEQLVRASAQDVDDPTAEMLVYRWLVDDDGDLGIGQTINLSLPAGIYNITVIATDEEGDSVNTTVRITVVEREEPLIENEESFDPLPLIFILIPILVIIILMLVISRKRITSSIGRKGK